MKKQNGEPTARRFMRLRLTLSLAAFPPTLHGFVEGVQVYVEEFPLGYLPSVSADFPCNGMRQAAFDDMAVFCLHVVAPRTGFAAHHAPGPRMTPQRFFETCLDDPLTETAQGVRVRGKELFRHRVALSFCPKSVLNDKTYARKRQVLLKNLSAPVRLFPHDRRKAAEGRAYRRGALGAACRAPVCDAAHKADRIRWGGE